MADFVIVRRDQAEHASQSLSRGSRAVVMGRLQQRSWTTEDGSARSVVEVLAEELGRSLGLRPFANKAVVAGDWPRPPVELVTVAAVRNQRCTRRPCPPRARSTGP